MKRRTITALILIILALCLALCGFSCTGCGKTPTPPSGDTPPSPENPSNVAVTGVDIKDVRVKIGDFETVIPTFTPSNATDKSVTWSVEFPEIASIDQNGTVVGLTVGSTTVTVTTKDGGKTDSMTVTVLANPVERVEIEEEKKIEEGEKGVIIAKIIPENATNKKVTYASSNPEIVTVDEEGIITGIKAGESIITVTSEDGNKTDECKVTVKKIPVTEITIDKAILAIEEGGKEILTATVVPENATNKKVTYESSNPEIVTVNEKGIITGVKAGESIITVTSEDGEKIKTCTVIVTKREGSEEIKVTGIEIRSEKSTIEKGEILTLSVEIEPTNATNKRIIWRSSNAEIISVDDKGKIEGKGEGKATIIAVSESGGEIASKEIEVKISVIGLIVESRKEIEIGEEKEIEIEITPSDATNKRVTYTSSDESKVKVDENGKIKGISEGESVITVTTEDGAKVATCVVTVVSTPPVIVTVPVQSVELNKTQIFLEVGGVELLDATVSPENATNKNIVWGSDNEIVVSVDNYGKITALSVGTANVAVTTQDGGFIAVCEVTVTAIPEEDEDDPNSPENLKLAENLAKLNQVLSNAQSRVTIKYIEKNEISEKFTQTVNSYSGTLGVEKTTVRQLLSDGTEGNLIGGYAEYTYNNYVYERVTFLTASPVVFAGYNGTEKTFHRELDRILSERLGDTEGFGRLKEKLSVKQGKYEFTLAGQKAVLYFSQDCAIIETTAINVIEGQTKSNSFRIEAYIFEQSAGDVTTTEMQEILAVEESTVTRDKLYAKMIWLKGVNTAEVSATVTSGISGTRTVTKIKFGEALCTSANNQFAVKYQNGKYLYHAPNLVEKTEIAGGYKVGNILSEKGLTDLNIEYFEVVEGKDALTLSALGRRYYTDCKNFEIDFTDMTKIKLTLELYFGEYYGFDKVVYQISKIAAPDEISIDFSSVEFIN